MSRIPLARQMVETVRAEIATTAPGAAERLGQALEHMRRRPPIKPRAARRSVPINPATALAIRTFAAARPDMSHQDIADKFGVNQGRVSEALRGER